MRILLLFLFVQASATAFTQSVVPATLSCADTTVRPVLLIFSGSDWCQPCIRLEKQVLADSAFQNYATTHLSVVKADFPQRKKLPDAERRENERLADRYNPEGKFPHIVLLRPDGEVLAVLSSDAENGAAFITQIKNQLFRQ
ncbi:MAG: hypothetical protein EPGJADBJ_03491 [Saprospiraceae bacterium]|nr:hypothetical protein [Saprospiraceae bacterium]